MSKIIKLFTAYRDAAAIKIGEIRAVEFDFTSK